MVGPMEKMTCTQDELQGIIEKKCDHFVPSIGPEETVASALMRLCDLNISAIPVLENNQIVGVFSERDYARKVLLQGKSAFTTLIQDVMTKNFYSATPSTKVHDAIFGLIEANAVCLPVILDGRIVAFFSFVDLVKELSCFNIVNAREPERTAKKQEKLSGFLRFRH